MTLSRFGHPNVLWALMLALAVVLVPGRRADGPHEARDEQARGDRPGADSPAAAMEWVLQAHRDESGNIPRDGLIRARAQADAMRRASLAAASQEAASGGAPAAAGISRSAWTWIGPSNIGGRVRTVVIPPNATSTILTGGVAGGIWKSTNGGTTWRAVDDFLANLSVSCMVVRPTDPNRLFVGTGEGFFNSDSIRGAGVFTSVNQGETWTQLPSTANVNFDFVNRLAFSSDGSILLAATRTGLFRSLDLGGSWQQVSTQVDMFDVKFISGSSTQVVASGRRRNAFHSSNGGQSWAASGGFVPTSATARIELAVSASSPNVVYASLEEGTGQIWKSTDHGTSYAKVSDSNHLSDQGWYDNALWVDPTNPDHVLTGGVSLFRSTNGGVSFSTRTTCHVDQHAIVHDPGYNGSTNRRVYVGSDGGVCKMEDVSINAVTSLRNGLGITQFYGADGLSSDGRIFGGTQDNGTLLYNPASGGTAWTSIASGDGGFSTADRINNYLYGEFQYLGVHRSVNGGASSLITGCGKPAPFRLDDGCTSSTTTTNFIAPILLDPNTPDRLLAGGRSLWRTDDPRSPNTVSTGPIWEAIKPPSTNNISAIAVAPGNSDIVWVGHSTNGDLYVTLNGTAGTPTWTKTDGGLPNRTITSIAVDRGDPRIAYVSFGGFSPDNLWRTTNTGATWQDVTGSGGSALPDVPIRSVVIHPFVGTWLVAATDVGVFASETGGASWSLPHDGPANVAVFQLFWLDANLVAVTHGRGMYTTPAASELPAFARHPSSQAVISGHAVAFNPLVVGVGPLSFQWYRGVRGDTSNPIPGATSSSYTTPPITAPQSFWVRATNSLGTADSNTATLTLSHWATLLPGVSQQGGASELATTAGNTMGAPASAANRSGTSTTDAKSAASATTAVPSRASGAAAAAPGGASVGYSTPAVSAGTNTSTGASVTQAASGAGAAFRASMSGYENTRAAGADSGASQPAANTVPSATTRDSVVMPRIVAGSQPVPADQTLASAPDLPNVLPAGRSNAPRVPSSRPAHAPGVTSTTDVVQHAATPSLGSNESTMLLPMIVFGFGVFLPPLIAHLWLRRRHSSRRIA